MSGRDLAATIGIRRLSIPEYNNAVRDLLEDTSSPGSGRLPPDGRKPFDSYVTQQNQISGALIDGVEAVASEVAAAFVKDRARADRVIGCRPASNANCLEEFVRRFGRRALRRPLTEDDVETYLQIPPNGGTAGDFYASVEDVVAAFLQDIEFLHRVEIGTPVAGVDGLRKLDRWELSSRLSYFLWDSAPPEWLLDHIEKDNGLALAADVRAVAEKLLGDGRARDQVANFHALWLGYVDLGQTTYRLAPDMLNESKALIGKVIFEDKKPWQDLFRSTGTIVSYDLAKHYQLRLPADFSQGAKPMWVSYDGTLRRGLLSQTSFLRLGDKFRDTSPTVRGKEIRERLFCETVPKPNAALLSKLKIDTSMKPVSKISPCKWDAYVALRNTDPTCKACHEGLDLIGFGLENFDAVGQYRAYDSDPDRPGAVLRQCPIGGHEGALHGRPFVGPGPLQDLMLASPELTSCVLGRLYQFGTGRSQLDDETDQKIVDALLTRNAGGEMDFTARLIDIVTSDAFAHRRMEN